MRVQRVGVSPVLAVVVVVIIVLAAGGAYYFLVLSPKGSPTTSSTGSISTTTSPVSTSAQSTTSSSTSSPTSSASTSSSSSSSSSASTQSSSSTSQSTTTTTCTTSTTSSGAPAASLNFTVFFANYASMTVRWNGTSNGTPVAFNSSYAVIAKTSTAYKVNVTLQAGTIVAHSLALVLKNGSAVWTFTGGMNYTGSAARSSFIGIMGGFNLQAVFGTTQALAQLTSMMHSTGSSTIMIGPTSVMVTNYVPNMLPLSYNQCGVSGSFTRFDLQVGTVTGKTLTLVTLFKIHGMFSGPGGTTTLDVTVRITSLTTA